MLYVMVFLIHVFYIYVAFALLMCGRLLFCASLSPIFLQSPLIELPEQYTLAFERPPDERIKKHTQTNSYLYIPLCHKTIECSAHNNHKENRPSTTWWPLFAAACAAVAVKRERRYNTFGAAAANALFTRLRIGFIK